MVYDHRQWSTSGGEVQDGKESNMLGFDNEIVKMKEEEEMKSRFSVFFF